MNFYDFTIQKNIFLMILMNFSVTGFGIDPGSIWASILAPFWIPLASNSTFWDDFSCDDFLIVFSIDFAPNCLRKVGGWYRLFSILFRDLFPHSCYFYWSKTNKYQKPCFSNYFKKLKECIHTCIFYLDKKMDGGNQKLRTLQGMILEKILRRLASFGFPLGSIWVALVFLFT